MIVVAVGLASPVLAVFWRRFHDAGIPGWVSVLIYIFFLGAANLHWFKAPYHVFFDQTQFVIETAAWALPVLIAVLPSQPGPNKYGPNPHEVSQ